MRIGPLINDQTGPRRTVFQVSYPRTYLARVQIRARTHPERGHTFPHLLALTQVRIDQSGTLS